MKITSFDRAICNLVGSRIERALVSTARDLGVSIKVLNGSFSDSNYTAKFEVSVINEDGTILSRKAQAFIDEAWRYGLKKEDLGREFIDCGKSYRITGLNTKARKMPITAECVVGGNGNYKFPADRVKRLLATTAKES